MKNFKKLFTFMFVISMIFTACNKDTSLTKVKNIDPTEQRILDFKEKMKSGDKSGETMTIEDAVWNIEATLNYTHCNPEANDVLGVDSIFITVNVLNNGEINFDEVVSAYNQLNANLINKMGENFIRLADVEFVQNSNKSEEKELKLTVVETKGGISNYTTFGDTDYWHAFNVAGKCGAYAGQYGGRDASTEIPRKANYLVAYPSNGYITNINPVEFRPGSDNPDYQDYLYYVYVPDDTFPFEDCMDPAEMNFFLNKLKLLANDYKPVGKEIAGYDMTWEGYNFVDGPTYKTHVGVISYGTFHYKNTPID